VAQLGKPAWDIGVNVGNVPGIGYRAPAVWTFMLAVMHNELDKSNRLEARFDT